VKLAGALAIALLASLTLHAQSAPRWVQPYPQAPEYWQLVGRLFGDSTALADEPRLKRITDPAVLAVGTVKARVQAGETAASFAMLTYNGGPENLTQLDDPHLVIKDLTQVRVVIAGTLGLMVDLRTASSSEGHMECVYTWMRRTVFLVDGLARAITTCDKAAFWSSWQRQPARLPFTGGIFAIDPSTALEFGFDAATREILTSLKATSSAPPTAR
jgi:hypothetical protein